MESPAALEKDGPFERGWFRTPTSAAMLLSVPGVLIQWVPQFILYKQVTLSYFLWPLLSCWVALCIPYYVFRKKGQLRYAFRLAPLFAYAHFIPILMCCSNAGIYQYDDWEEWIGPLISLTLAPFIGLAFAFLYGLSDQKWAGIRAALFATPITLLLYAVVAVVHRTMGKHSNDTLVVLLMLSLSFSVAHQAVVHLQFERMLRRKHASPAVASSPVEDLSVVYIDLLKHRKKLFLPMALVAIFPLLRLGWGIEPLFFVFQIMALGGWELWKKGRRDQGWIAVTFFTVIVMEVMAFAPQELLFNRVTRYSYPAILTNSLAGIFMGALVGWYYSRWYKLPLAWKCMGYGMLAHVIVGVMNIIDQIVIAAPYITQVPAARWILYLYWFAAWAGANLLTLWFIKRLVERPPLSVPKSSQESGLSAG